MSEGFFFEIRLCKIFEAELDDAVVFFWFLLQRERGAYKKNCGGIWLVLFTGVVGEKELSSFMTGLVGDQMRIF